MNSKQPVNEAMTVDAWMDMEPAPAVEEAPLDHPELWECVDKAAKKIAAWPAWKKRSPTNTRKAVEEAKDELPPVEEFGCDWEDFASARIRVYAKEKGYDFGTAYCALVTELGQRERQLREALRKLRKLEDEVEVLQRKSPFWSSLDSGMTHYEGCWRNHRQCAFAMIAALTGGKE